MVEGDEAAMINADESMGKAAMDAAMGDAAIAHPDEARIEETTAASLMKLAATDIWFFSYHKARYDMVELMLPVHHPCTYRVHDDDVNEASVCVFWMGRSFVHR